MQVVHPMQKCPAEFVGLFQEVLENANFNDEFDNVFICVRIRHDSRNTDAALKKEALQWIDTVLAYHGTFNGWLGETSGTSREAPASYSNECRKAWLEWLVSPEGHYVHE